MTLSARHTASTPLRFGILGAARIAPNALIRPARRMPGVQVVAVAARDPARARAFAQRHAIARVHLDYAALIADPEVDAIYNPLPNSLHGEWSIRALQAGKHVLCEKPLAANAQEAAQMRDAAQTAGRVLMEAFHYRYHPLTARLIEIIRSGELGTIRHVEAHMAAPLVRRGDIRYRYDLAGGATMDMGCYTIHLLRTLAGAEPEVIAAQAKLRGPSLDRAMAADLRFPGGTTGRIVCSLWSSTVFSIQAHVRGDQGDLSVINPFLPHLFHRLTVRAGGRTRHERIPGESTYTYQLHAFLDAVHSDAPFPTGPDDAIANMQVIDAVYRAAGLPLRGF
ncbi:MAG: Gfo/Idh/MocA family oxidoreductase [Caldilineaceae bacterium]|nr:Gfo/Idh/MocA family oxidoreductase [Caldilineaceae bacterium]